MCLGTTNDKKRQLFQMQLINTIDKTFFFTKHQQAEAKRARKLFNSVGCRSVDDLKSRIRMNLIIKNKVTNEAVQWTTKIYGADNVQLKSDVIMNFNHRWIQSWQHTIHQSRLITLTTKSTFCKQRETINILRKILRCISHITVRLITTLNG